MSALRVACNAGNGSDSGPTGRDRKAQGNALGWKCAVRDSPERARFCTQFTALGGMSALKATGGMSALRVACPPLRRTWLIAWLPHPFTCEGRGLCATAPCAVHNYAPVVCHCSVSSGWRGCAKAHVLLGMRISFRSRRRWLRRDRSTLGEVECGRERGWHRR